jgi:hypothetical protein
MPGVSRTSSAGQRILTRLRTIGPFLEGSLTITTKRCGKLTCRCVEAGPIHEAAVLVGAPTIPEQDEWPTDLTGEMAKKPQHLGTPNVAAWMQRQRQGDRLAQCPVDVEATARMHDDGWLELESPQSFAGVRLGQGLEIKVNVECAEVAAVLEAPGRTISARRDPEVQVLRLVLGEETGDRVRLGRSKERSALTRQRPQLNEAAAVLEQSREDRLPRHGHAASSLSASTVSASTQSERRRHHGHPLWSSAISMSRRASRARSATLRPSIHHLARVPPGASRPSSRRVGI